MTTTEVIVYSTILYIVIGTLVVGWKLRMNAKTSVDAEPEEYKDQAPDDDSYFYVDYKGRLCVGWKHPA
jgi:hypothetical protein